MLATTSPPSRDGARDPPMTPSVFTGRRAFSQFSPEAHFVRRHESHSFVKRARLIGSVEHEPVELFGARPGQNFFHQGAPGAALPPFGFGENVEHNRVSSPGEPAFAWWPARMRRHLPQL